MSLNTTPRTWVAGEVVTAANMNAEIRDAFTGIQAAWDSFTPVWTAVSVNPTIGNGTITGRWIRYGKSYSFQFRIVAGSTTTYGTGGYLVTGPATPSTNYLGNQALGTGTAYDTSALVGHQFTINRFGTGNAQFVMNTPQGGGVLLSPTSPMTWANTDIMSGTCGQVESA